MLEASSLTKEIQFFVKKLFIPYFSSTCSIDYFTVIAEVFDTSIMPNKKVYTSLNSSTAQRQHKTNMLKVVDSSTKTQIFLLFFTMSIAIFFLIYNAK